MEIPDLLVKTLMKIPWFLELTPGHLDKLAGISDTCQLPPGELLFSEGDPANCLYILLEGELALETFVPSQGGVRIFTAEPLDIIGFSALTPVVRQRTATARALTPIQLICFNGQMLRQLCDEDHDLGYIIMRRIANVTASRLLTTRLQLFDIIHQLQTAHPVR